MGSFIRGAVSKKKRRYQKNGFDLDLTYVTPRIVAMGFPSENVEAAYRNPMKEVLRFLDSFHKDHYKVYNLCSERSYDHEKFYNRVEVFPFDDHNAPPFELISLFCQNVEQWLAADDKNIAVIHCKAGKGRTGLMISAWMLYSKEWTTAKDALTFYAAMRTYNQKGVTIPSQIRYVHYFAESLQVPPENKTLLLNKVIFHTLPKAAHIPDINFHVHVGKTLVFTYKDHEEKQKKLEGAKDKKTTKKSNKKDGDDEDEEEYAFECGSIPVFGDINVEFSEKSSKLFAFWFSSLFVKNNRLTLKKEELDKAHKDTSHKSYSANFNVELVFSELSPDQAHANAASPTISHTSEATLSPSSSASLVASPSLKKVSSETEDPDKRPDAATALASVLSGEWWLNKGLREDDETEDGDDDPNELSEKLISLLLEACKGATRGGVVIETHTHMVRSSPLFRQFQSLVPRLSQLKLAGLSPTASLAFWLNVHNTLTLHARILLAETPKKKEGVLALHQTAKYRVGGRLYSGSDIEIGVIRAACELTTESPFIGTAFAVDDARRVYASLQHEARVVFALYRGTESCPDVRIYSHKTLHEDLDEAAKHFLARESFVDISQREVWIPRLIFWHKMEFGNVQGLKDIVRKYMEVPIPEFSLKYNQFLWEFEVHPWFVAEEKEKIRQIQQAKEDEQREREKRHKKERRSVRYTRPEEHDREHKEAKGEHKDAKDKHRGEKDAENGRKDRRPRDDEKRTPVDDAEKGKSRTRHHDRDHKERDGHRGHDGHRDSHRERDGHRERDSHRERDPHRERDSHREHSHSRREDREHRERREHREHRDHRESSREHSSRHDKESSKSRSRREPSAKDGHREHSHKKERAVEGSRDSRRMSM